LGSIATFGSAAGFAYYAWPGAHGDGINGGGFWILTGLGAADLRAARGHIFAAMTVVAEFVAVPRGFPHSDEIKVGVHLWFAIMEKLGFCQLELPHLAGLGVELENYGGQLPGLRHLDSYNFIATGHGWHHHHVAGEARLNHDLTGLGEFLIMWKGWINGDSRLWRGENANGAFLGGGGESQQRADDSEGDYRINLHGVIVH